MREELVLDIHHRQVVFTIPKMLRVFFKYNRSLLSDLCLCGKYVPSKGWAEMIRKVYEVDPLLCPSCRGQMSIITFIEDHKVTKLSITSNSPSWLNGLPLHNVSSRNS
jgi:hypothetical protein